MLPVESVWSDPFCVFLSGKESVWGRLCKSFLALAELAIVSWLDLDFPFLVLPATDGVQCGLMIIMLLSNECTQLQLFVGTNEIVFSCAITVGSVPRIHSLVCLSDFVK